MVFGLFENKEEAIKKMAIDFPVEFYQLAQFFEVGFPSGDITKQTVSALPYMFTEEIFEHKDTLHFSFSSPKLPFTYAVVRMKNETSTGDYFWCIYAHATGKYKGITINYAQFYGGEASTKIQSLEDCIKEVRENNGLLRPFKIKYETVNENELGSYTIDFVEELIKNSIFYKQ